MSILVTTASKNRMIKRSFKSSTKKPSSLVKLLPVVYKRAAWTAAYVLTCFVVVNATTYLQSHLCMFRWDRPETWGYTFALTGSPMCRMLSQTNSFFHHAAGTVLNMVF